MQIPGILLAAFCTSLCLVLSFLACTIKTDNEIPPNWWLMFVLATYLLAPFPIVIFGQANKEGGDSTSTLGYWAWFTTGWIFTASFGIPAILAHTSVIALGNCLLSIGASITFYGFALLMEYMVSKDQ